MTGRGQRRVEDETVMLLKAGKTWSPMDCGKPAGTNTHEPETDEAATKLERMMNTIRGKTRNQNSKTKSQRKCRLDGHTMTDVKVVLYK